MGASLNAMLRWSWKEVRQGDLISVIFAMILVVSSVFALTALATRMEQVVIKQGKDALMADLVFISANPISDELYKPLADMGLTHTDMTRFSTMMFVGDEMKLVSVKAVSSEFPLKGNLVLGDNLNHVSPGEVWLDPDLMASMQANVGDDLSLGDFSSSVSGVITEEPGLSFNPFRQMPTVFIHRNDVAKTGAIQVGSRVQFRVYINATPEQVKALKDRVKLEPGDRWRDTDSQSRTADIFNKTQSYLSLVVMIVVLMASLTQFLSCQHYARTRAKTVVMLKSLGATRSWLVIWLLSQTFIILLISLVFGTLVGIGFEFLLRIPLKDLLPNPLPPLSAVPLVTSASTCLLVSLVAMGIPFLKLLSLPASSVIQPESSNSTFRYRWLGLAAPLVIAVLWVYQSTPMIGIVLFGIALAMLILGLLGLGIFKGVARLPLTPPLRLAFNRIKRSSSSSILQLGALSLSLMLISTLWLVKSELLADWQRLIPANAPNVFAFNISPYDKDDYAEQVSTLSPSPMYPIARGRLTKINGIDAKQYAGGEQASDALRREVNVTWDDHTPDYNEVIEGSWTDTDGVSVEMEVATELGLKVGDTLEFSINGMNIQAKVNSIRRVEWRDMKPNFYFIFTPDVMSEFPASWLVSYRIDDHGAKTLSNISKTFPTVSVIDLRSMLEKIQGLLEQVVWAISMLAIFGVLAGMLLISTLLNLSIDQRKQEMQLYRILGSSRKTLQSTLWAEFAALAFVAGVIASIGADSLSAILMKQAFDISSGYHISLWVTLPILSVILLIFFVKSSVSKVVRVSYHAPSF